MAETSSSTTTADQLANDSARPSAPLRTETFRKSRPSIVGADVPEPPFPIYLEGAVQKGFGRGGKDLGCPTANLPEESLHAISSVASTGIYYGFAQVLLKDEDASLESEDQKVWPMAMSLGWNPYYKNERLSAEVHIIHNFKSDFYGFNMKVLVLGYIRPELDYTTRDALIDDIETDKRVALQSLDRPDYKRYSTDEFFARNGWHS